MSNKNFKAGFISIVGLPNAGKSTLMNKLVGERISIITSKAQTTRNRILGVVTKPDHQIVYSDTPGILKPVYKLQNTMMSSVKSSFEDADVVIWVTDLVEKYDEELYGNLSKMEVPIILLINKMDLAKGTQVNDKIEYWKKVFKAKSYLPISALKNEGIDALKEEIINLLPVHPPYFPDDTLTDKPEKFFVEEIIREKVFVNYKQEVPYSVAVEVEEFKEEEHIIRIRAIIFVERNSQKGIIIGKGGKSLKKTGTEARQDLEIFFNKKVFLENVVKVMDDWRRKDNSLKRFGYKSR